MSEAWEQLQALEGEVTQDTPEGKAWYRGMQALAKLQEEPDPQWHFEAADAFLEALSLRSEWTEALMGLAYWLVLAGDEFAAMHYAQRTLTQNRQQSSARNLLKTLESTTQANQILKELAKQDNNGAADDSPVMEVQQLLLLLQAHHQLLEMEMGQAVLQDPEQIHSRQRSLETLGQMLAMQLEKGFPETDKLQVQLAFLQHDLEKLKALEHEIQLLRNFRKEVQLLFQDMTHALIAHRLGQSAIEPYEQAVFFEVAMRTLNKMLDSAPSSSKNQMIAISGWQHLQQQLNQFKLLAGITVA